MRSSNASHTSLRDAQRRVYWTDQPGQASPRRAVEANISCDLLVVGGGYTGLWAALQALERDPGRQVVVIESEHVGFGASSRNGGFCDASITHGLSNGIAHFGTEIEQLVLLGRENYAGLVESLDRYEIDADFEAVGQLSVATQAWQLAGLREQHEQFVEHGEQSTLLDRDEVRAEVASPSYLGGVWQHSNIGLVDPAKLCTGLAKTVEGLGATIYHNTAASAIANDGAGVSVTTQRGTVRAAKVVLATNAFRGLVPAIRRRVVPVWDYVLVSEPLTSGQMASIGWANRQGLSDAANLFHYFRLTADNRILWGGYDAIYHVGSRADIARYEQRDATFNLLATQFFAMFPQLDGLRFSHRWGGPIGTTSRFCVTFGTAYAGKVAFAVGYTGLGVGASRFGARVGLDLLDQPNSELRTLDFVRSAPFPFPPEPLRSLGIQLTRRAIARSDASEGRVGVWLKLLDRFGIGFDS